MRFSNSVANSPLFRFPQVVAAILALILYLLLSGIAQGSEADLAIPDLHRATFDSLGGITAWNLLACGSLRALNRGIRLPNRRARGIGSSDVWLLRMLPVLRLKI